MHVPEKNDYILEMTNINKSFSTVQVLHNINLKIKSGTIHALLGENGAGKSTIVKIINGFHSFDSGSLKFDGKNVLFKDIISAAECGIGMVYQELSYAANLSIAENIFLGREPYHNKLVREVIDVKAMYRKAEELLKAENISINPRTLMRDLPVSDIQMIEILKVVSATNAKLVIMDEPTSALSERETVRLFEKIRSLKERGVSVIYISHKMDEVKRIADYVTVLRDGRVVETGRADQYDLDTIVNMIVGRKVTELFPANDAVPREKIFEVKNLTIDGVFKDISF